MMFLLEVSGPKILLINAEEAAGPMDKPKNYLLNSYCGFSITNCFSRRDCSSNGF